MARRLAVGMCGAVALFSAGAAQAGNSPWSMTLYAGPSSTAFVTQILDGKFDVNGGMVGLAVDRGLFRLGSGISIAGEVQVTDFFGKYAYQTGAIGLGLRFDEFPWSDSFPMSIAVYTGPSYAPNAPIILDPKPHQDPKFLNYVSLEFAFQMNRDWDATLRAYHRSGAWGVYSNTADVGSMIGVGLRRRF
jgi:hypothetical protein